MAMTALLGACGGGEQKPSSAASDTSPASQGRDTGRVLDEVRVGLPGSLSNLYPGVESGILNYYVAALTMEGLLSVDSAGKLQPALARRWSAKDPRTYVFSIRQDATFTDGSPVKVSDILYSIKMARDAKVTPSSASYWSGVSSVKQTGPWEITFRLSSPNVSFDWVPTVADALWVAPEAFWKKHDGRIGTSSAMLIGSGPFKVTAFSPDSQVVFERTDTWWDGVPKVKKFTIQFISDENARLLARKAGDIDVALNVPLDQVEEWKGLSDTQVISVPDRSWVGLMFNYTLPPFNDIHVRKAVAHAIDRQAIVDQLLHGLGQVATAMSTPEQFGGIYTPAQATKKLAAVPQYDFDMDKAKQELAQSSVPDGFTFDLTYPNTGPQLGKAALSLAQNLKSIGVTMHVKEQSIEQWLSALNDAKAPVRYMWYFSTTGDPAELADYLLNDKPPNPVKYSNPKVSALLNRAQGELDAAKRADQVIEAQVLAGADLPYLSLWWGQSSTAFARSIGVRNYTSFSLLSPWSNSLYSTT